MPDLDTPDAFAPDALVPQGGLITLPTGWRQVACPKCASPAAEDAVSPYSVLANQAGPFFCAQCGWHGDSSQVPGQSLITWGDVWARWVQAAAQPVALPAELAGLDDLHPACAPAWDGARWAWAWHLQVVENGGAVAGSVAWLTADERSRLGVEATFNTPLPADFTQSAGPESPSLEVDPSLAMVPGVSRDRPTPTSRTWQRPRFVGVRPLGWAQAQREVKQSASPELTTRPDEQAGLSTPTEGSRWVMTQQPEDLAALRRAGVLGAVAVPADLNTTVLTSSAWRVLEFMEPHLSHRDTIVLALPDHDRALEEELGRRLSRDRCRRARFSLLDPSGPLDPTLSKTVVSTPSASSASAASTVFGSAALASMIDRAPPFPVVGIHELVDMEEKFDSLYQLGLAPGVPTGYPSVDSFYTVKPGQWTLVTGIPGHGKSTWLDDLLVNLARDPGWRFGVFSPENQPPERHFAGLMEKLLNKPFSEGPTPRITPAEKDGAKRWLNDRFKIILPSEENGEWTLDAILALGRSLVLRHGVRGLVIDPWNEIDHSAAHDPRGGNEVSYLSEALTKVRRFARMYDVHVWLVAHPVKMLKGADGKYPVPTPYDVAGGAHWRNKADNVLAVYRYVGEVDDDVTDIHVQKIRFREVGRVGRVSLRSNPVSGKFIDDIDQDKRAAALEKGLHLPSSGLTLSYARRYPDRVSVDDQDLTLF